MGNTSTSYLGSTDSGLGSVGRGGTSNQTAAPIQTARDRLRRRMGGATPPASGSLLEQGNQPNSVDSPMARINIGELRRSTSLQATQNQARRYASAIGLQLLDAVRKNPMGGMYG